MIYLLFISIFLGMLSKSRTHFASKDNAPNPKDIVARTDEIKSKQLK